MQKKSGNTKLRQETIRPERNKTYQNTHTKERKSDRRKQKTQQKYKIKTQGTADKKLEPSQIPV